MSRYAVVTSRFKGMDGETTCTKKWNDHKTCKLPRSGATIVCFPSKSHFIVDRGWKDGKIILSFTGAGKKCTVYAVYFATNFIHLPASRKYPLSLPSMLISCVPKPMTIKVFSVQLWEQIYNISHGKWFNQSEPLQMVNSCYVVERWLICIPPHGRNWPRFVAVSRYYWRANAKPKLSLRKDISLHPKFFGYLPLRNSMNNANVTLLNVFGANAPSQPTV